VKKKVNINQRTKGKTMKSLPIMIAGAMALTACAMAPTAQSEHPAAVTFGVKDADGESVLTFWRKMNDDGTKGKRFSVGGTSTAGLMMNTGFDAYAPIEKQLDAGTYFLDSFQVNSGSKFCVSQGGHYMMRNGWDDGNNKPLFVSFTVQEAQMLTLPVITFAADCKSASFDNASKIFTVGAKFE
jgi:hypothetical protein